MSKELTVITTTYHAEKCLPLYFKGVMGLQGLDSFFFLLVMNEPSEEEKRVAYSYQSQYSDLFQIIEVPKRETIGASLNRGFAQVNTPYCSFLDVDDIRVPDSYLRQIATLEQSSEADFTYGDFIIVKAQGTTDGEYVSALDYDKGEFLRGCHASPTQLFRKDLLKKIMGFDEQLLSGGDFDFQVRAAFNCGFQKTPGLLCYYTKLPSSASASSGILQPIERTVIELRYGMYGKTILLRGFPYVKRAQKYRLDQIKIGGEWKDIREMIPDYTKYMVNREPDLRRFERDRKSVV
jgi:glycosyltransferase involved in cell wall biosynthesis